MCVSPTLLTLHQRQWGRALSSSCCPAAGDESSRREPFRLQKTQSAQGRLWNNNNLVVMKSLPAIDAAFKITKCKCQISWRQILVSAKMIYSCVLISESGSEWTALIHSDSSSPGFFPLTISAFLITATLTQTSVEISRCHLQFSHDSVRPGWGQDIGERLQWLQAPAVDQWANVKSLAGLRLHFNVILNIIIIIIWNHVTKYQSQKQEEM